MSSIRPGPTHRTPDGTRTGCSRTSPHTHEQPADRFHPLRLGKHREDTRAQYLPQAQCVLSRRSGSSRLRSRDSLTSSRDSDPAGAAADTWTDSGSMISEQPKFGGTIKERPMTDDQRRPETALTDQGPTTFEVTPVYATPNCIGRFNSLHTGSNGSSEPKSGP